MTFVHNALTEDTNAQRKEYLMNNLFCLAFRFINHITEKQCARFGYTELEYRGDYLNLIKQQLALHYHLHLF